MRYFTSICGEVDRRVGGYAADAVIIGSKIIRRESGADNNRRVGG